MQQLAADAQAARFNSLAESTKKNFLTHLRSYLMFVIFFGLTPFPIFEDNLIVYIQFLSRNFKSVSSIKNYTFGLQTISHLHGF